MAVNMLVSYAYFAGVNLTEYRADMPCGRLMIDSGAFTAESSGKPILLDAYAEYLERWAGAWDTAVTLDVIGDPKGTRKNTLKLHARGIPVMPVFTRGDKPADFDAMVKDAGYVCVGGGVGMPVPQSTARLRSLQRRAEELGGGIHALGVGSLSMLRKIRPYSADASNVAGAFRFGCVPVYTGSAVTSVPVTDKRKLRKYATALRAQGVSSAELLRTGRLPVGERRGRLMQNISIAYVCADEDTTGYAVPTPSGVEDSVGTHLYSAVPGPADAAAVAVLDGLLHGDTWSVPMWRRYAKRHTAQCRVGNIPEPRRYTPNREKEPTP